MDWRWRLWRFQMHWRGRRPGPRNFIYLLPEWQNIMTTNWAKWRDYSEEGAMKMLGLYCKFNAKEKFYVLSCEFSITHTTIICALDNPRKTFLVNLMRGNLDLYSSILPLDFTRQRIWRRIDSKLKCCSKRVRNSSVIFSIFQHQTWIAYKQTYAKV